MTDDRFKVNLQDFFHTLASAGQSVLLLDYDGTLAPFRLDRYQAVPYHGVTAILQAIVDTGRTRLVMITGRRASELMPLLKLSPSPEIWGSHGLEHLGHDGSYQMEEMDRETLDALFEADHWIDALKLHDRAEHKPGSLAIHWRGLSQQEADDIRSKVLLRWVPIAERSSLMLEPFDGGLEIRMANRSKGDAVRSILSEVDINAPVAYLGDDECDEDVFHVLKDRGLSVLVRQQWRETAADLWLRPPDQLRDFLHDWLQACLRGTAAPSSGQMDYSPSTARRA
jgi:trehalose 6-phosphate phosphatase